MWSLWSENSVLSICSQDSVLSSQATRALRGRRTDGGLPTGVVAAGVVATLAAIAVHRARRARG